MTLESRWIEGPDRPIEVKIATPTSASATGRLIIISHGLPLNRGGGVLASRLLPELAERIASEVGWTAVVPSLSGVGETGGTFSARGWTDDLAAVIDAFIDGSSMPSLAGFGLGGALCLKAAASDERIRGVVVMATPANLALWCGRADRFAITCEMAGVIEDASSVSSEQLVDEVLALDPLGSITTIPPRHLMIVHGADDSVVPVEQARMLVDAAHGHAELRIVQGAGHFLRPDPRMVATLLGWLERRS
ncbi:MAG: alpha/beta fold hydrolase [Actinomycetes bacterium]